MTLFERYTNELRTLSANNRTRKLTIGEGIDFTSNDFLGLSGSTTIRTAITQALHRGVPLGAGGSRLLRGNFPAHIELEEQAAAFFRCEKSLYFANGFSANFTVLTTLPKRHDLIVFDALSHASIRMGISSALAKSVKVPHNDIDAVERVLSKWHLNRQKKTMAWVVVESLYSMDGDFAPLTELLEVVTRYDAVLLIDEAHATGVWGQQGRGLTEAYGNHPHLITVHTCGKALGTAGALVCAPAILINVLINQARPFIYSTAPPPINAIAVSAALQVLKNEPERRQRLWNLIVLANQKMTDFFGMDGSNSQIIPLVIGEDEETLGVAKAMQEAGFDVRAIRPPTVPEGTARLRISITLNVSERDISNFFDTLSKVINFSISG